MTTTTTTSISRLSFFFRKKTRMKFEKKIFDYLTKTEKNEKKKQNVEVKRHEKQMLIFKKLTKKL
jgi:hypothetical protein